MRNKASDMAMWTAGIVAALLGGDGAAAAEGPGGGKTNQAVHLPEVRVTVEKVPRALQHSFLSVAVLGGDHVAGRRGDFALQGLFEAVPNVNESEEGFSIRGIESSEADSFYGMYDKDPVITIYLDGALTQNHQLNRAYVNLWDVEQVEIVRGPSSTLHGGKSFAGSVHIKTLDPTFYHTGQARVGVADADTRFWGAAHGGPLNDEWACRVAASYFQTDGFNRNSEGEDDVAYRDRLSVRSKLLYRPRSWRDASALLTLSVGRQHVNPQGDDLLPLDSGSAAADRTVLPGIERDDSDVDTMTAVLNLRVHPDSGWRTDWETACSAFDLSGPSQFNGSDGDVDLDEGSLSTDYRISRRTERSMALLGLYLDHREHASRYDFMDMTEPLTGYTFDLAYDGDYERRNLAAYGNVEIDLNARCRLVGGLRVDYERVEQSVGQLYASDTQPFLAALSDVTSFDGDFLELAPKAGVVVGVDAHSDVSLTVQRAFRGGGLSVPIGNPQAQPNEYDPEVSTHLELGWRSTWRRERMLLNANLFYVDWKDRQVRVGTGYLDPRGVEVYTTRNAASADLVGGEVSFRARPAALPGLELRAGGGYTDVRESTPEGSWSWSSFSEGSEWDAVLAAAYQWSCGARVDVDASHHERDREEGLDNYSLANARVGLERGRWGVYVYGANLFDEEYLTSSSLASVTLGDPRVIGAYCRATW